MTPKGWTQRETIALLTIVHMSTKLDGPKMDEDLANALNQPKGCPRTSEVKSQYRQSI
jgi:hypothetical protein